MNDDFDMESLPTLENLDGSTESAPTSNKVQNTQPHQYQQQNAFSSGTGYVNRNTVNNSVPSTPYRQPEANEFSSVPHKETFDDMMNDYHNRLIRGGKIAKVIGIASLCLCGFDLLLSLIGFSGLSIIGSGVRIALVIRFMKGDESARAYMLVLSIFCIITAIIETVFILYNGLLSISTFYGLQIFLDVISLSFFGAVFVLLFTSKDIKAYFLRK